MITKTADTRDFRVQRAATTMRHSVTESIRQAIALGHYKAGERMPERDLCEMTGVSRTLVREALRQLESEGLVVVVAHKGPTVARITPEQAKGVYQVREVLESLAAKLFAENASDQDIARITQALDGVREAYMHGDVLDRLAAKNHFYDCLVAGTGNEADNIDLVVNDARTQTFHPEAFTQLGIDLARKRHVCVKSSNHYRAGFAPIASTIIPIAAPGAITPDFTAIPYRHRSLSYWPRVENPFA